MTLDTSESIFSISGTEGFRLTSTSLYTASGINVGIGTSSPGQKLTVAGGINVISSATLPVAQGPMLFSYEAPINRIYMGDGTGYSFAFSKRVSSTTTDLMVLTDGGNLGVGTSSPTTRLDVQSSTFGLRNARFIDNSGVGSGGRGTGISLGGISNDTGPVITEYARLVGLKTNGTQGNTQGYLTFETDGGSGLVERARITDGGYFKASNAGTYVGSTGTYHELRNTANETAALFSCSNTGFTSSVMSSTAYPVAGTGFNHLICRSNNGNDEVMKIRGDGNLYNTNGTYGTISDQRLKQDIADAPSQWNDIKAVRFRKYRMKDDVARDENAPYLLGVVAQELEQVSPGLVDDGEVKTVKSSILLMKAAVALQEAMTRIEQLEAKVAALESK